MAESSVESTLNWMRSVDDCHYGLVYQEGVPRLYKRVLTRHSSEWIATGYTGKDAEHQLEKLYRLDKRARMEAEARRLEEEHAKAMKRKR